jgi:hypothetical protein
MKAAASQGLPDPAPDLQQHRTCLLGLDQLISERPPDMVASWLLALPPDAPQAVQTDVFRQAGGGTRAEGAAEGREEGATAFRNGCRR